MPSRRTCPRQPLWRELLGSLASAAWWELGDKERYLWDHLVEHLIEAGRPGEEDAVAGDLR